MLALINRVQEANLFQNQKLVHRAVHRAMRWVGRRAAMVLFVATGTSAAGSTEARDCTACTASTSRKHQQPVGRCGTPGLWAGRDAVFFDSYRKTRCG